MMEEAVREAAASATGTGIKIFKLKNKIKTAVIVFFISLTI